MSQNEISDKVKELKKQADAVRERMAPLKEEIEVIGIRIKQLQRRCKHPNSRRYNDRGGDTHVYCPDCGYDN